MDGPKHNILWSIAYKCTKCYRSTDIKKERDSAPALLNHQVSEPPVGCLFVARALCAVQRFLSRWLSHDEGKLPEMSVLLVTYDLKDDKVDYTDLIKALKRYNRHHHAQKSVWFLDTLKTPFEVRDYLQSYIKSNDDLFVVRLHKHWASSYTNHSTIWLKNPDRRWD